MINLNQINRVSETQTERVARNYRRAYYLASNNCKKCRISENNYLKAIKCIKLFNSLNNARDKSLFYDSLCTEAGSRVSSLYDVKCNVITEKLNKMLKGFGYFVTWGTFAHVSPIGNELSQLF